MKTCETCKFWKATDGSDYKDKQKNPLGDCSNENFVYDKPPPSNGLMYWDAESDSASFATGKDFGCIHHQEKSND